jgi:hypothetical protein
MMERFVCAALASLLILFVAIFFLYIPILKVATLLIVLLALVLTFILGVYAGNSKVHETTIAKQ